MCSVVPGVDDPIRNLGRDERDGGICVELLVTTGGGDFKVSSGREDDGKEIYYVPPDISAVLAVAVPGDEAKEHLESEIDLRGRLAVRDCMDMRWGSRCRRRGKRIGSRGTMRSARRGGWRLSQSRRCE
jgi:hypothetical protein